MAIFFQIVIHEDGFTCTYVLFLLSSVEEGTGWLTLMKIVWLVIGSTQGSSCEKQISGKRTNLYHYRVKWLVVFLCSTSSVLVATLCQWKRCVPKKPKKGYNLFKVALEINRIEHYLLCKWYIKVSLIHINLMCMVEDWLHWSWSAKVSEYQNIRVPQ